MDGCVCVWGGGGACVYYTTSPTANQLSGEPRQWAGDLLQQSRMAPAGQASPLSEVHRLQGKPVTRLCPESAANSFQNLRKEGRIQEGKKQIFKKMCPLFIFFPNFWAILCGMWGLSSSAKEQTHTPSIGSVES